MKIETKFLGEVDITNEQIIQFDEGIPGFEEAKQFVLLPIDADLPIASFQCTTNAQIGFIVAYPFTFKLDYAFDLSDGDKESLQIEKEEDVLVYSIMTLKETFEQSTVNLLAPIIINKAKNIGKQLILQDGEKYPLRFQIGKLEGSAK